MMEEHTHVYLMVSNRSKRRTLFVVAGLSALIGMGVGYQLAYKSIIDLTLELQEEENLKDEESNN